MILDLISPFPEKMSTYKDPSQREAWVYFNYSIILPHYFSIEFLENFFPKREMETDTELDILDREALPYEL